MTNPSATEPEDRAHVRLPPPLLFLASTLAGYGIERLTSWGVAWPGSVRLVGVVPLAVALVLVVGAFRDFARTKQNPEPWTPSPELIVSGPYRFTRNPMYLSLSLIQVGVGCLISSVWVLAFVPISMAAVYFVAIRLEEAYLERRFGGAYRRYRASTRRWI